MPESTTIDNEPPIGPSSDSSASSVDKHTANNGAPVTSIDGSMVVASDSPLQLEEVEQALLGAILRNNRVYDDLADRLNEDDFHHPAHRVIFRTVAQHALRGQQVNALTLKHFLSYDDDLLAQGGSEYLTFLENSLLPSVPRDYARILRDLRLRRGLLDIGRTTASCAQKIDPDREADELIEEAEEKLFHLSSSGDQEQVLQDLGSASENARQIAERAMTRKRKIVGVTTGFTEIDRMLGGLHDADLLILAGRPSMGKTALGLTIAYNAAQIAARDADEPGRTLFFSLEMSAEQLATRLIASRSGVSNDRIRRGEIRPDEFDKITEASKYMADLPLYIDDSAALSVSALRQRARRAKRQKKIDLVVVDYLQLLHLPSGEHRESRVQEVSSITRALKALAKDLNVPVLVISQLSRAVESREPPRPMLSDLRDSGAIEQDADVVMFVYREEYYKSRKAPEKRDEEGEEQFQARWKNYLTQLEPLRNKAELIISKQRHGPISTVNLFFEANLARFSNLDTHHTEEQVRGDGGSSDFSKPNDF